MSSPGKATATRAAPAGESAMHRHFETNGGVITGAAVEEQDTGEPGIFDKIRSLIGMNKPDATLRSALADYMEESAAAGADSAAAVGEHEHALISNVVMLRDMTVVDVMIPRADIAAIAINTSQTDLLALLSEKQFSRLPVFRETLDDMVGSIHIKDILACLARNEKIRIEDLVRDVPIVSPSMPVLDLILMMKQLRKHMVFVVDEYGGIDGLVTIGDVIEAIIGEVEDEHASEGENPQLLANDDGTVLADARLDIESFEQAYGRLLTDKEREDIDTLGGLIFAMAGRIPARGELLTHESGMVFEIIDADPRRVNRVLIRNIPAPPAET